MGTQKHVRPRVGAVAGYVEYTGPAGGRVRKEFDNIGGQACRRFYVKCSEAGLSPRLVNPAKEARRG